MIDFVPTTDGRALGSHGAKHYRLTPLGTGRWRAERRSDEGAWVELAEPASRTVAELTCDLDADIPVPPAEPDEEAATLIERIERVRTELADLQDEVDGLGHFLGSFHAVNGLRQARTFVGDCLARLRDLQSTGR